VIIDVGQLRGASQINLQGTATSAAAIGWFGLDRITGPQSLGNPDMSKSDIIVLGSLAGLFCWIYIVLPLAFYHN
jgi:hypothetical protein